MEKKTQLCLLLTVRERHYWTTFVHLFIKHITKLPAAGWSRFLLWNSLDPTRLWHWVQPAEHCPQVIWLGLRTESCHKFRDFRHDLTTVNKKSYRVWLQWLVSWFGLNRDLKELIIIFKDKVDKYYSRSIWIHFRWHYLTVYSKCRGTEGKDMDIWPHCTALIQSEIKDVCCRVNDKFPLIATLYDFFC